MLLIKHQFAESSMVIILSPLGIKPRMIFRVLVFPAPVPPETIMDMRPFHRLPGIWPFADS